MASKRVLVTGGNSGIGLALCKQLVAEDGCHVFLGSRSVERGLEAVQRILEAAPAAVGRIEVLQVDTSSDGSVAAAAAAAKERLGGGALYALVNNGALGYWHDEASIVNTNLHGVRRMTEAFVPLLDPCEGRIVNVGSGGGPAFIERADAETRRTLCSPDVTWAQIQAVVDKGSAAIVPDWDWSAYGLSKATMVAYTVIAAREHPNLRINACSPGAVDTPMAAHLVSVNKVTPEQGTFSIRHLLFQELEGNGGYYGSDAIRSPLDHIRNPGNPQRASL